jgi:hypothetical protein
MAVCDKTFHIYTSGPYADQITPVPPAVDVPLDDAADYDCHTGAVRPPSDTKRGKNDLTILPEDDCCGETGCC